MHYDTIQNCVRYFEGSVGDKARKAYKFDEIKVNDYANYLIDKKEKKDKYVDYLLTKAEKRK